MGSTQQKIMHLLVAETFIVLIVSVGRSERESTERSEHANFSLLVFKC